MERLTNSAENQPSIDGDRTDSGSRAAHEALRQHQIQRRIERDPRGLSRVSFTGSSGLISAPGATELGYYAEDSPAEESDQLVQGEEQ